jgi:hypothetical protein
VLLLHTCVKERLFIAAGNRACSPSLRLGQLLTLVQSFGRFPPPYPLGDIFADASMQIALFLRFPHPLRQPSPGSNQRFMAHF